MEILRDEQLGQNLREDGEREMGAKALTVAEMTTKPGETVENKKTLIMEAYPFLFENKEDRDETNVFGKLGQLLPYWRELGVDAIWLAPVYPSPRKDMGYDVSDYQAIDHRFGTMDDFDKFVAEAHSLGQKVMMDLVLNHTSTNHEWFQKALAGDPKYRNFYYFTKTPSEDWHNFFDNKSAWAPIPDREGEYYLHSFHPDQADLRWFDEQGNKNQPLFDEFRGIIDFWTKEHDVDGFRLDVPQAIDKDFSNQTRDFGVVLGSNGTQSSKVVEELFGNREGLFNIIEVFDPTPDCSIIRRYAGPSQPMRFAMNAFNVMGAEEPKLEQFLSNLKNAPDSFAPAIQSHDTRRHDSSGETLETLLKYYGEHTNALVLYNGQEINMVDPEPEALISGIAEGIDAETTMKVSGGHLTGEALKGSRGNGRILPMAFPEYIEQLSRVAADNTHGSLKFLTHRWKGDQIHEQNA